MLMTTGRKATIEIQEYVRRKDPKLQRVVRGLRSLVKKTIPRVTESVNPWGIPTFELNGPLCYFMVGKNHVTFGFLEGTSLKDPKRLLEGTGKKLRHVKLRTVEELRQDGLRELLKAAARRNREAPRQVMARTRK